VDAGGPVEVSGSVGVSGPVEVSSLPTPVPVLVPDPLPVEEVSPASDTSGSAAGEVAGLRDEVVLGFALLLFLIGMGVVRAWGARSDRGG
jgi:hypothetical protein